MNSKVLIKKKRQRNTYELKITSDNYIQIFETLSDGKVVCIYSVPYNEEELKEKLKEALEYLKKQKDYAVTLSLKKCYDCKHYYESCFCGYNQCFCKIYGSLDVDQNVRHPDKSADTCPNYEE